MNSFHILLIFAALIFSSIGISGLMSPTLGSSTMKRLQFINILKQQLGHEYKLGGEYPYFDCASLVQYAYSKIGITVARAVTEQSGNAPNQINFNTYQKLENILNLIKPGDQIGIDFNPGGRFDHVITYIGGSSFIQATGTGDCPCPNSRCKVVIDPVTHFTGRYVRSVYSYFIE